MSGIERISKERTRQIEVEGYDAEHDRHERPGALTMAAISYAIMAASGDGLRKELRTSAGHSPNWPWEPQAWRPGLTDTPADRIRELTKAGALIAAEIDRIEAHELNRAQGMVN